MWVGGCVKGLVDVLGRLLGASGVLGVHNGVCLAVRG